MLKLNAVHAGYGRLAVLHGINLDVMQGRVVGLLGANGAGKTTLLSTIMGLLPTREGTIEFMGESIANMKPHAIVKRGVTLVPQGRELFPTMTVRENLELAGLSFGSKDELESLCEEQFSNFPRLRERQVQRAQTLSGGEQQMLAVARALMLRPKLLLLDEPTMGLAPMVVDDLGRVIRKLCEERGQTILVVEQNLRLILSVTENVHVIRNGRNVFEGETQALRNDKDILRLYLE
jgi:branched-chain amino acid transport system ATP-binding protein